MNWKFYVVGSLLITACNSQSKMGKVKYGKDGAIENASGIMKCTPPLKRYTKSLDAVVKANIDSVSSLPKGSLELGLKQAVTRLSDYSSEGLDIDLILFRLCEMANNRGLTAIQVDSLTKQAIEAWSQKKTSKIDVTNYGVNNGIMAGVLVLPENSELPVANNFTITPVIDSNLKKNNRQAFELKPKQGTWQVSFIAYPSNEDSLVNGFLMSKMGVSIGSGGRAKIIHNNTNYDLVCKTNSVAPANMYNGHIFYCTKKPSILFFGDANDPRKQYWVKL